MASMKDKISPAEAHTLMKKIKEGEAAEDASEDDLEKKIVKEVKKQEEAAAVSQQLAVSLAKQKKIEKEEKEEEAKEEEARLKRKKDADEANLKADQAIKAAAASIENANNMAIASTLPSNTPLPTPESQGLVKSLAEDKTQAGIEPPAPVMRPG